jgi:hypothetical protein
MGLKIAGVNYQIKKKRRFLMTGAGKKWLGAR